jgi:hypothetical protein
MSFYSYICSNKSFINKSDINIKIPGGLTTKEKDWYPFVITFNDDEGFSNFIGRDLNYTVLYNFGAFEYLNGASMIYNPQSQYYSSFYGAYFIKELENSDQKFAYDNDGKINIEEAVLPGTYDINTLVLGGFRLDNPVSNYYVNSIKQVDNFIGFDNWTVIDMSITTHGFNHKYKNNYQSYIQYGKPPSKYNTDVDFPIIKLKSRIYVRYFESKKCTVFLYVIAPNRKTIEECDKLFLQKATIN